MTGYKNLEVWKKSMQLVKEVYTITVVFPKQEAYGLTSQTRRAAVSVPANIAEGCGRQFKKDTRQFLHVARGSLYELETLLDIAVMIEILSPLQLEQGLHLINETQRLLNGLIKRYESDDLR